MASGECSAGLRVEDCRIRGGCGRPFCWAESSLGFRSGSGRADTKSTKRRFSSVRISFLMLSVEISGRLKPLSPYLQSRSPGKERDTETGLDSFPARYYGSTMGRWMSPDPLGGHLEDPQTLNRYAYVRNNPLNLTDPTGLDFNLNCDKNNGTTCQGGHQYYKDKDGNYQETVVKSDKDGNLTDQSGNKYQGEVDGLGVHFSQDGRKTSSLGTWVNGSNETKFSQTSGALAGFSFEFHQTEKEQTANGTFYFPGAPRDAYDAVLKAGFSASLADDFFNPLHGYIGSYHYRSDGDPGTGKNSGHLILRGVGPWHPWDTVPTRGELHFGETNPNVNRLEHFRKDVF